jgi:transcriptional regulator with XRE-family HTH domain
MRNIHVAGSAITQPPSLPVAQASSLDFSTARHQLGERIRDHRKALGISQEGLADRSDLHWTFVGQVERGKRNISLHNLLKLAAGVGVDAGELVHWLCAPQERSKNGP